MHCKRLVLADTAITDASISAIYKLKFLTAIDVSRCHALTDESLTTIRRHCSLLNELHVSDCRHLTTDVLCQTWKDCTRLHTLTARGCPGVTDKLLQCIATTKRTSPEFTLRALDVSHCKFVTSSGISYIATATLKDMHVVSLSLSHCLDVDNMAFFGFEASAGLASLVTLDLRALHINETAISWIVKGCMTLRSLSLAHCLQINDFCLLLLQPLVARGLQHLNLKACDQVSDKGIQHLLAVAQEQQHERNHGDLDDDPFSFELITLNLKDCCLVGDDALHAIGQTCGQLRKLNLKGLRRVSDSGITSIGKGCEVLEQIKLSGRFITEHTYRVLGKMCRRLRAVDTAERLDLDFACIRQLTATCPLLQKLNLHSSALCDVGVAIIACAHVSDAGVAALASCSFHLQTLLLSYTRQITDKALRALADAKLPLVCLDLCGNTNITDEGIEVLSRGCQRLQELRLKNCDRLSVTHVQQLNRTCLPFTATLQMGATTTLLLSSLPPRHVELLQTMLRQYENVLVLQTHFRKWKQRELSTLYLEKRRQQRRNRAAKRIQRCFRRFVAWHRYLRELALAENLPKVIRLEAHVRGYLARWHTRVMRFKWNRAARCIQRHYRPYFWRWRRYYTVYVLVIQRVYRGYLARQLLRRLLYQRRVFSANAIGVWYRRCVRDREVAIRTRWLLKKIQSIQGQWRVHTRRTRLRAHVGFYSAHATKIESQWRRILAQRFVARRRVEWTTAALVIQSAYRSHFIRCEVYYYCALVHRSATRIQSAWRGLRTRRGYHRQYELVVLIQRMARYKAIVRLFRRVVHAAVARHRRLAATCIQRHVRGRRGRKRALLFRKIRRAKFAHKGQNAAQALMRRRMIQCGAALRIQHWIRRVQARRRMLKVRKWRRTVGARALQRYLRAWLAKLKKRRQRERLVHAAINLQRAFRGHLGRRKFKAEFDRQARLRSARLLQRVYRGHAGRRLFKRIRREMMHAATLVQRAFRTRQSKKIYEIALAAAALKAKDRHDHSILGRLEALRNPLDELYKRAKLPREKEVLVSLREKWTNSRVAEERAVRKLRKEASLVWNQVDEVIGNHLSLRRKLYGVTENVYASHVELQEREDRQVQLRNALIDVHKRLFRFKHALAEASTARRMLDVQEIFDLLRHYKLFREPKVLRLTSNQDDDDG
ncbi:TPA: hypothetical protein N0F65_010440 [Lagenidium giganteum]|uniref:F-box/LRR-repeat protein 15-like leucin rich repeat domain-containing protein n=1 Tax=Lagenidium giganteum TaxID=4803 RepID=A0AAV2YQ28_9STRA|nr:TPA: hypothetical protein N0F65_010440 [Lagenidium giganteum]